MSSKSPTTWTAGKKTLLVLTVFLFLGAVTPRADGTIFQFEIFTTNGAYFDNPNLDFSVDVTDGTGIVDFIFYNDSTVASSIARVYYDDGTLLDINSISYSTGVEFSEIYPGPGNLPSGNLLDPNFVADKEFSIGSEAAPPENGIDNPGEWLKVTFDLINGGTLADVIDELNTGVLRIGLHVIAFSDGSSESAVNVPEPATLLLLGLGGLALLRKRRT